MQNAFALLCVKTLLCLGCHLVLLCLSLTELASASLQRSALVAVAVAISSPKKGVG